jgi:hypothetical protein
MMSVCLKESQQRKCKRTRTRRRYQAYVEGEYVRAPKERTGSQGSTTTSKPQQSVLSLHAGIILFTNAKLSCLTARIHADETRRRVPERHGKYTSKGTVGVCVLRQEGTEAKAASLHELPRSFDARVRNTTLGKIVDIRT